MDFLVNYIVFHPDNYQGASGTWINCQKIIQVLGSTEVKNIKDKIEMHIKDEVFMCGDGWQDSKFKILSAKLMGFGGVVSKA